MFRKNIAFIMSQAKKNVPLDQIIAAFAETFLAIEEYVEHFLEEDSFDEEQRRRFEAAMLELVHGLGELNAMVPSLKLEGNVSFLRNSIRRGNPADGILFFTARTFDAIRAPISFAEFTDEQRAKFPEIIGHLVRGVHALEPLL